MVGLTGCCGIARGKGRERKAKDGIINFAILGSEIIRTGFDALFVSIRSVVRCIWVLLVLLVELGDAMFCRWDPSSRGTIC